jgi:hypothetical protein
MGQAPSVPVTNDLLARIKPLPGSSGARLIRRNSLGIYDESCSMLYIVRTSPEMTIQEMKMQLPRMDCVLILGEAALDDSATVSELGLNERTLLRILNECKKLSGFSSTEASSDEIENIISKCFIEERQTCSEDEIHAHFESEFSISLNLTHLAVPDVRISTPKKDGAKKRPRY